MDTYKKKYEDALAHAREIHRNEEEKRRDMEFIFPELKESEDEKIREYLIRYIDNTMKSSALKSKLLTWLEKQGEQKPVEEVNGEDYGIDGLWHAQRILEKTLGKVDGYQTDDGILSHKCAITAVKKLYEQKPAWSEEDKRILDALITSLINERFAGSLEFLKGIKVSSVIDWLKSLKEKRQ